LRIGTGAFFVLKNDILRLTPNECSPIGTSARDTIWGRTNNLVLRDVWNSIPDRQRVRGTTFGRKRELLLFHLAATADLDSHNHKNDS
jgi:hypothetical protein